MIVNAKPIADRLEKASPRHVTNIMNKLSVMHGKASIEGNTYAMVNFIRGNYTIEQINRAHFELVGEYAARSDGSRAFRKGRPPGAKNRSTRYAADVDALADLPPDAGYKGDEISTIYFDEAGKIDAQASEPQPTSDMSAYVLKTEFNRHVDVVTDITGLLRKDQVDLRLALNTTAHNLHNKIDAIIDNRPTIVEIKRPDLPVISMGVQHKHFAELLLMCNAAVDDGTHLNVWLHGPAGTGKTTAARMAAKALGLDYYSMGALETGFQVLGYNDANGKYCTTLFRECFEHGGVICLDEQDSYTPSASLALNGALANGHCAFADKIVERHPNCIVIAGANTTGLGGTMEYVGRMKQDAAFLDRFVMLDWPIDNALEACLCPNEAWLNIVRHCRKRVIDQQIKGAMVTPRASIYGAALLRAGVSIERVMKATLQKGMSDAQWGMIKPSNDLLMALK